MKVPYRIGHSLFRRLSRGLFHFDVIGRENLIESGGCLVASNHESFLDPPFIGCSFENEVYYLARKTLFKKGIIEWIYRAWNSIPVDQQNPGASTLKAVIKLLKSGQRVVVFPEGQRSHDGVIGSAEPGVGMMVAKANVPVLPVRIFGAHEALPRGRKLPRPKQVTLVVGKPIYFDGDEYQGRGSELYQRIADDILVAIGELDLPGR